MSQQEHLEQQMHSQNQFMQQQSEERKVLSQQRRKEYNDLKIISMFDEEKLKDRIDMMSPQIRKGQQLLTNDIIEVKEKQSPAKLMRMSTQFEIEKSHSNVVKRAAQSVFLQSEYGISDIDDRNLFQRITSNDYNPQFNTGNRSLVKTPSISIDKSEKSPSPRNKVGMSPTVSSLYDKNALVPKQLKLGGQRDAKRASFLKPSNNNTNQQHTSAQNLLNFQYNNHTDDGSSVNMNKSFITNNKEITNDNMLPSQPSIEKKYRDTYYVNTTNYNGALNSYTDYTLDNQFQSQNDANQIQVSDPTLFGMRDPSFLRQNAGKDRQNMRVMMSKQNVDIAMRVNQHILNLDIEEMNRNTRFFKDYIKDQQKQHKGKSTKGLPTLKEIAEGMFKKQDSLTKGIQKESAAPLRRLTKGGIGSFTKGNRNLDSAIKSKFQQSIKNLFGSGKIAKEKQRRSSLRRNTRGVSLEDITEKSQIDDESSEKNIIKKHSLSKSIILAANQGNADDDDINEQQIRRINQGRARSKCLMYPDASVRGLIDGVSFILLLVISVYIPFILAFNYDTSGPFDYFELFIDIWFLLEITANFFTGQYHKGILIMDRQKIFITYLQGWFFVDLLSSAPILVIQIANQDSSNDFQAVRSTKLIRMLRFARYARLLRLIKFLRLNKYLQPAEELIVTDYMHLGVRFLKISCAVIFITHWAACMMYTVGVTDFENEGRNWLQLQQLNDATVTEQYINSLYWASTTMCTVGYGDYHPITSNERIVSIFVMIMSSGVFAFIIGDIGRMVSSFNLLAEQFREKMIYVDRFLTQKCIPLNLRVQVKRYLEYNWQLKKTFKIEEHDLLSLLNENLRGKITVYFNGRILQNIDVLCKFPIEFLSNLSFLLRKETFSIDDNLIVEKAQGQELFYMQNGRVSAVHMKTKTHLTDLEKDRYFGEISFFTILNRQATIKARDFTEVLIIHREDFLQMLLKESFRASLLLFHKIRDTITDKSRDYKILGIRCYICYTQGHIAIQCKQFHRFKGNLKRYYKKIYQHSFQSSTESYDESKQNPVPNTEETMHSKNFKLQRQKTRAMRRRKRKISHVTPQKRIISDNQLLTSQVFGSIYNDIVFPIESQPQTNGQMQQEEIENIEEEFKKLDDDPNRYKIFNQTPAFGLSLNSLSIGNSESRQQSNALALQGQSQFESESLGEQVQIIHFDTPPKEEQQNQAITPSYRYRQRKSLKKRRRSQKGIRDVIQEELYEEDEESLKSLSISNSEDESSQYNLSKMNKSEDDDDEEDNDGDKAPLLSQSTSKCFPGAPRAINELTKLIGRKKRFKSKNLREEEKIKLRQSVEARRKIHIRPMNEIQKEIKTTVQKTFTTMVETITKEEKYHISPNRADAKQKRKQNQTDSKSNVGNFEENKQSSLKLDQLSNKVPSPLKSSNEEMEQKIQDQKFKKNHSGSVKGYIKEIIDSSRRKNGIVLTNISQVNSNNSDLNVSESEQKWPTYRKNIKQDSAKSYKDQQNAYSFKQDSQTDPIQTSQQYQNEGGEVIQKQVNYFKKEDKRNQLFINNQKLQVFQDEQSSVIEKWDDMEQILEEFKRDQS